MVHMASGGPYPASATKGLAVSEMVSKSTYHPLTGTPWSEEVSENKPGDTCDDPTMLEAFITEQTPREWLMEERV